MGFETGSDNERIEELERQLDDIIDSQINSIGGNESLSIDSTLGQRNDASGDAGGVRSNQPIIHNITENDESGTPTGVFDRISLISSMIIVDHTSTPIDLRFIQGPAKDGAKIKITVKKDKVLVIKSGGNILTSSDITISDTEFFILVKHSEAETGISGGAYKILLTGTGGVSFPIDFPELNTGSPTVSTSIDFADSDRHFRAIILSDDLQVDLTNIPAAGALCTIYFTQDGVGGHVPTIPLLDNPDELSNIDTTANSTTVFTIQAAFSTVLGFTSGKQIFFGSTTADWANFPAVADIVAKGAGDGMSNIGHLDFIDNLATPVAAISLFSDGVDLFANTGGGTVNLSQAGEFFGPWTANHDAGTQSLTNLAAVQIVDVGSIARGSISGDVTLGVVLSTATGGKFSIQDVITPIATFDDTTGLTMEGTHVINMNQNVINTIGQLQLDRAVAFSPTVETGISFDNTLSALNYNVGLTSDIHAFRAGGELLASITRIGSNQGQLSTFAMIATSVLQTNGQLFFADSSTDPTTNGEMRRNGIDVKVFTGGGLVNLTGLDPTQIIQGNTFAIVNDAAPGFVVILDGVQKFSISNTRIDYAQLDLFGVPKITMDDGAVSPTTISTLTASLTGLVLNLIDVNDFYDIQLASNEVFHIDTLRTRIRTTTPSTTPVTLDLFRDDASPTALDLISLINFTGRDSAANPVTYGQIETLLVSPTNGSESSDMRFYTQDAGLLIDTLAIGGGGATIRHQTETGTDVASLSLLKVDSTSVAADNIGELEFRVLDTPTFTTYSRILGKIVDQSDAGSLIIGLRANGSLADMITMAGRAGTSKMDMSFRTGTILKASGGASDHIGFFVTADPGILDSSGSEGTMQMPHIAQSPTLDGSELDSLFGNFLGAYGVNVTAIGSPSRRQFYIKVVDSPGDGTWAVFRAEDTLA